MRYHIRGTGETKKKTEIETEANGSETKAGGR